MVTKMETEDRITTETIKSGEKPDMQMLLSGPQSLLKNPPELKKKKKNLVVPISIGLVLSAAVGTGLFFYFGGREETDDAYVDGHISNISSRVSGIVQAVYVDENQRVKSGEPLVKLDPSDYKVAVDADNSALVESQHQAEAAKSKISQSELSARGQATQADGDVAAMAASINSAKADIAQTDADVKQAQAKIVELEAQVNYAKTDFNRYNLVYESRAVTQQQFDQAKEKLDVATAQRDQGYQSLDQLKQHRTQMVAKLAQAQANLRKSQGGIATAQAASQQTGIDSQNYAGDLASVKRNQANLEADQLQVSYTDIKAPVAGKIGRKAVEVGQRVEPGQALFALVQDDAWITANFKETQVGRMHQGQKVEVKIDTFPSKIFWGRVESLSPASGAKFSILPPDNATGNFTKVVQRIPVKIVLDKDSVGDFKNMIAPGMSCVTTVLVNEK